MIGINVKLIIVDALKRLCEANRAAIMRFWMEGVTVTQPLRSSSKRTWNTWGKPSEPTDLVDLIPQRELIPDESIQVLTKNFGDVLSFQLRTTRDVRENQKVFQFPQIAIRGQWLGREHVIPFLPIA